MKLYRYICVLFLFFWLLPNASSQCIFINTIPNYNCVTSVCEITITISSSMGSPPYTITSSPAGINGVMTGNTFTMTNIPYQPNYNISIGSGTCTGSGAVLYSNPTTPNNIAVTQTNVSCHGGTNGAASAVFTGGAPFTWQWSTGSTASSISGLAAGVYTVSMTNAASCAATTTFMITEPGEIKSGFTPTLIPCAGSAITTTVGTSGGNSPFTYTLNGSPLTTTASAQTYTTQLSAGTHTILTKDTKGCTKLEVVQLNEAPGQTIASSVTPPACPGQASGAITATVSGPVAGYSYSWSPVAGTTSSLSNVPAGSYTLHVLDASGCKTKSVITVPPAPPIIPNPSIQKENCSAADGAFTLSASGINPPFSYTTIPTNIQGNVVTGLSSGTYTTIIKDGQGCVDSFEVHVGNLSLVSLNILTVTPVKCYNVCNGSVILAISNAVQPVTYSLTGLPSTTNNVVSNLCAGFYLVKAVDNSGCPAFDTINFPTPPAFSYSVATPAEICIGRAAVLKAMASGGTGTLSYLWNPGALSGQTVTVEPVVTTNYSLNVYDAQGCTQSPFLVTVNVNPKLSININSSSSGICPGTTAQITPTVSGGDGNYSYEWLPGNSKGATIFVENITVPTYTLIVNDGCGTPAAIKEITIKLHPATQPVYKQSSNGGCAPSCLTFINTTPGSRNAIWNYGDRPYEQRGDTTIYCYDKGGNYNLRLSVTDSNSCRASHTYSNAVKVLVRPDAGFVTDPGTITLNEAENVLIKNISDHGDRYSWYADGDYLGSSRNINYTFRDTGCYDIKLLVENQNFCRDSMVRSICVFEGFNFYMPGAFTPNNDGLNDVLQPKGTGWLFDNYTFEVYNRWGIKVFSTNNANEGWNGGVETDAFQMDVLKADPNDIYIWRAVVTDNLLKPHELRGSVMLVR